MVGSITFAPASEVLLDGLKRVGQTLHGKRKNKFLAGMRIF
jgi:hypothetical protein